jgi:hypothetical protein
VAWRPARSLTTFHDQLKAAHPRAVPPATVAESWGTVGDLAHQTGSSDHNPRDFPGWGEDIVTAADWPHAPALGPDAGRTAEALRVSRDSRIKYVIFNRRTFSSYPSGSYPAWTWRPYSGSNPHTTHGHLSVVGDSRADSTAPWQIGATVTYPASATEADSIIKWNVGPWSGQTLTKVDELLVRLAAEDAETDASAVVLEQLREAVAGLAQGPVSQEQIGAAVLHVETVKATALLRSLGYTVTAPGA